jgi:hypothetical protein
MQLDSSFMRCATARWQASPQNIELALGAIMRASENGLGVMPQYVVTVHSD